LIADVDIEGGEETARGVRDLGRKAIVVRTDVSDRTSVEALADAVVGELGIPSLIFNNAGVVTFKNVFEMTSADWSWVMGVNLGGVINGVSVFLPLMVDAGKGGHIVNTSSSAGLFGIPGLASYCASKTAVVGLSEHLRGDLEELKIGVSVLCPGGVATNIVDAGRSRPSRFGGPESTIFVATPPGQSTLTPILSSSRSPLKCSDKPTTAVFDAQYDASPGIPKSPAEEDVLTI
jgi:NAD(P)-dependent dehydrogenase (short-subunit alcohol dehydrogenase family)